MFDLFRKTKCSIKTWFSYCTEFHNDCKEYKRWNYNNPKVRTKNAFEAKMLRQAHILEKGMSLSHPRDRFGTGKASELLDYIDAYEAEGYSVRDSAAVQNCLGVLDAYLRFHRERGFIPEEITKKFERLKPFVPDASEPFGIRSISKEQLRFQAYGGFPDFFQSRHSVRQFSNQKVSEEDLQKAVQLAMRAPSACNRQSCKVYYYSEDKINRELGNLIAGNTGFESDVQNYLVITSDMSAFYDVFERNQVYVDGGIFTMALIEALHYYGIASCVLQNGEFKQKNESFKKICGNIPANEKIILFIAIGYYKDIVTFATSHRKELKDVLIIR